MAVLFVAAMPCIASAQYAQTKVGQKLTYTVTDKANNKTNRSEEHTSELQSQR